VIPYASITRAKRRFTASAVFSRPSVACCSGERKLSGGFGWDAIDRVLFTAESLGKQMPLFAGEWLQATAAIAKPGTTIAHFGTNSVRSKSRILYGWQQRSGYLNRL